MNFLHLVEPDGRFDWQARFLSNCHLCCCNNNLRTQQLSNLSNLFHELMGILLHFCKKKTWL